MAKRKALEGVHYSGCCFKCRKPVKAVERVTSLMTIPPAVHPPKDWDDVASWAVQ